MADAEIAQVGHHTRGVGEGEVLVELLAHRGAGCGERLGSSPSPCGLGHGGAYTVMAGEGPMRVKLASWGAGTAYTAYIVMAGEGRPSTTSRDHGSKVVDGRPPPTMTWWAHPPTPDRLI